MGLEKTAERIREEAKAECARILAEANSAAEASLEAARADGKKVSERILLKGQDDAKFAGERVIADAKMEANKNRMRLQSDMIQKAIEQSRAGIEKFAGTKAYFPILEKLAIEAASLIGGDRAVVIVRKKDEKHLDLEKVSTEAGIHIVFAKRSIDVPGVMVESVDGRVRIDNTCAARMKRDEGEIRKLISTTLFTGA